MYTEYTTTDDCLAACAYVNHECLGALLRTSPFQCYLVFDETVLVNRVINAKSSVYVLMPVCDGTIGQTTTASGVKLFCLFIYSLIYLFVR